VRAARFHHLARSDCATSACNSSPLNAVTFGMRAPGMND
jgi:hypothetical protein